MHMLGTALNKRPTVQKQAQPLHYMYQMETEVLTPYCGVLPALVFIDTQNNARVRESRKHIARPY